MATLFKQYSRQLIFSGAFILALMFNCESHCSQIKISGQITIEQQAFSECPLIVQPQNYTIITDADGMYHVYLQKGWSGKIVPLLKGFRFFPGFYQYINMQLNRVDQNYDTTRLPDDYFYPPQIMGPKTGETWEKLSFQILPSGLKYFYIWSDQQDGEWGSEQESHFWRYPGYYCVRVLAKDDTGRQSDWSDCHLLQIHEDIPGNLPPTKPTVFGAEQGITGIEYSFYANSSDPEEATPIKYQFKMDDYLTDWQYSNTWRHIFDKPGAFIVQAQAKDPLGALSNRSDFHTINIELAHAPETPSLILSQYIVTPELSITAKARSIDQDEDHYADRIHYQFDFGDNSQSEWIRSDDQWAYADHSWYTVGTYCVKVVARDDSGLVSPVSECREIEVKLPNHPPSIPTITGPEVGYTHTEYAFVVNAFDPDGDVLEYFLEINTPTNNGVPGFEEIVYDWQESKIFHHAFDIAGTYIIKAAVQEKGTSHPDVWSGWHDISIHSELIVPEVRIQCPTPNYACNNRCNGRYASGGSLKIVWKKSDHIDENRMQHVNLFYAIDDNPWIKMGESDTTSFDWKIPDDFLHDHVKIKIIADFAIGTAEVISDPVAFYDARIPDITISPGSPAAFIMNDPIDIHWQITCAPGYDVKSARLEFHTAGSTRKTIENLNQTQAREGSYTWIPDNCRYRTNSGQFNLYAICSNCQENEVWSDTFSIQFEEDPSNPWQKSETAFDITPDPNYFQYLREPDVFVDFQNNIHFITVYCKTSKGNDPNETQLYYRKKNMHSVWENRVQITNYSSYQNIACKINSPELAVDYNGTPHVIYEYTPPESDVTQIYHIQRKNDSWTQPENLSELTENYAINPKIVITRTNDIYAFWRERYVGVIFRVLKNGQWTEKKAIPIIYGDYDITIDTNNIIHIAGTSKENRTYYLTYNGLEFSETTFVSDVSLTNEMKIMVSNDDIFISGGSTFRLFRKTSNGWSADTFHMPEEKAKSFSLFKDQSDNLHVIYSGNHYNCDVMMERVFKNNEWQAYQPVSNFFITNTYTISNNANICGIVWDGQFEYQNIIYYSFLVLNTGG